MVAIVVLGTIDVGNLYFQKRDVQRIADMAALAAVQPMTGDQSACLSAAKSNVTASANSNDTGYSFTLIDVTAQPNPTSRNDQITVTCGRWDPSMAGTSSPTLSSSIAPANAAQVTVYRHMNYYFMGVLNWLSAGPPIVSASATARATDIDAFSIGTSLAMFGSNKDCAGNAITSNAYNPGLVNSLLSALLNTSLTFDIGTYQALACTNVKIDDLRAAFNVGTVDQLLNGSVSINQLAGLMVTALSRKSVANAQANVDASNNILNALASLNLPGPVALGDSSSTPGLLSIGLANTQNAANATVSLLDLLFTAAEITNANAKSPAVSVNTGLNLLGLAQAALQVQVIRPPVIAIGEGGTDPMKPTNNPWRTSAHTADIAVYLNIGVGTWSPLGPLANTQVSLPLYLEVAPGQAWLTSTSCMATRADSRAYITAQPGLTNVCIGDAPLNSQGKMDVSAGYSCGASAKPSQVTTLVNVSVLNGPLKTSVMASVPPVSIPGVVSIGAPLTFDGITGNGDDYQSANSNQVGQVLTNALKGPAAALSTGTGLTVTATLLSVPVTISSSLLGSLLSLLSNTALNPIFGALDQLLVPLLQLLGVQVGVATVHNMSLTCGVPQLVSN
jgi:uncharacterized membrane protein